METNARKGEILPSVNLTNLFGSSDCHTEIFCNMYWAMGDLVLLLVIILGNVMTILAVRLSRRLRSVMSNQLILSLAISDLFVGFAVLYHLLFFIAPILRGSKIACLLKFVFLVGTCCASFYNVTAIAMDRYIAILHPLEYPKYMTKKTVFTIITLNWTVALFLSTIPMYWNVYEPTHGCELSTVIPRYYFVAILVPMFLIVWLSILLLYWRIWKVARIHALRSKENGLINIDFGNNKSNQVVLTILGCFSLCWLPYVAVAILQVLNLPRKPSATVYHLMFWMAMCNSGVNPLIYAWKNPSFRKAFHRLLRLQPPDRNYYNSSFKDYVMKQRELRKREVEREARNEFRPVVLLKTISAEVGDKEPVGRDVVF